MCESVCVMVVGGWGGGGCEWGARLVAGHCGSAPPPPATTATAAAPSLQVPGLNHYEHVIEAVYDYWRAKHQ